MISVGTQSAQTLTIKLVYYGPALSGKTTNLIRLHDALRPTVKGEMMVLETHNDRTLFFDAFPLGIKAPSGLFLKIKVFTVPGQVIHDSTRKAVLSRADGVVFVADSQRSESVNNSEAFSNLLANLRWLGQNPQSFPIVVQFNKRDLNDIMSEQELQERWASTPWPDLHFACARTGAGVAETFAKLLRHIYAQLDTEHRLSEEHGLSSDALVQLAMQDA